jgi:hypothetical protein
MEVNRSVQNAGKTQFQPFLCLFFLYAEAGDEAAAISSPFTGWTAASFVVKDTPGPNPPCGTILNNNLNVA